MSANVIDGKVRPATADDLPLIRLKLQQMGEDTSELEKRLFWVIEHNGIISGCVGARLVWQVEPLCLWKEFTEHAPPVTLRRAVFKLARAAEGYLRERFLRDRAQGRHLGLGWYFAYISRKPMQRVAREYGMMPVYREGKLFGKEL